MRATTFVQCRFLSTQEFAVLRQRMQKDVDKAIPRVPIRKRVNLNRLNVQLPGLREICVADGESNVVIRILAESFAAVVSVHFPHSSQTTRVPPTSKTWKRSGNLTTTAWAVPQCRPTP